MTQIAKRREERWVQTVEIVRPDIKDIPEDDGRLAIRRDDEQSDADAADDEM
jgi:hypothetical protein